jgi:single-strand DNA-binding protein
MASLNRVDLIGRLGADPESRRLNDGSTVVNLRLAVTDTWRDKNSGERKERTEWASVVIFNEGLAKVAEQFLKKGDQVFVSGSMQTRKWEKDGVERYTTEVVLQKFRGELQMLGSKQDRDGPDNRQGQDSSAPDDDDSDLPF